MQNLPVPESPILNDALKVLALFLGSAGGLQVIAKMYGQWMSRRMKQDEYEFNQEGGMVGWIQKKFEANEAYVKQLEAELNVKRTELFDLKVKQMLCDTEMARLKLDNARYKENEDRLLLEIQRLRKDH
jgi:hypothetical protein